MPTWSDNTGTAPAPWRVSQSVISARQQPGTGFPAPCHICHIRYVGRARRAPTLKLLSRDHDGGGAGYAVNDILTLSGGTFQTAAMLRVTSVGGVNGSAITGFTLTNAGVYTALPLNPIATSLIGGSNITATFNGTWGINSILVSAAGNNYSSPPTVTISGDGTGATATATLGTGLFNRRQAIDLDLGSGNLTISQTGDGGNVQIREVNGSLITSSMAMPNAGAVGPSRQIALLAAGGENAGSTAGDFVWNGVKFGGSSVATNDVTSTDDHIFFGTVSGTTANILQINNSLTVGAGRTFTAAASSPLNVVGSISAGSYIVLASRGDASTDGVFVQNAVSTTSTTAGSIAVTAQHGVTINPAGSLTANAQDISVTADDNRDNAGAVTIQGAVNSQNGNITITGEGVRRFWVAQYFRQRNDHH